MGGDGEGGRGDRERAGRSGGRVAAHLGDRDLVTDPQPVVDPGPVDRDLAALEPLQGRRHRRALQGPVPQHDRGRPVEHLLDAVLGVDHRIDRLPGLPGEPRGRGPGGEHLGRTAGRDRLRGLLLRDLVPTPGRVAQVEAHHHTGRQVGQGVVVHHGAHLHRLTRHHRIPGPAHVVIAADPGEEVRRGQQHLQVVVQPGVHPERLEQQRQRERRIRPRRTIRVTLPAVPPLGVAPQPARTHR